MVAEFCNKFCNLSFELMQIQRNRLIILPVMRTIENCKMFELSEKLLLLSFRFLSFVNSPISLINELTYDELTVTVTFHFSRSGSTSINLPYVPSNHRSILLEHVPRRVRTTLSRLIVENPILPPSSTFRPFHSRPNKEGDYTILNCTCMQTFNGRSRGLHLARSYNRHQPPPRV